MRSSTSVAVVGAGPYGLSIAAHLLALGLKPRVFGQPMQTWRSFMPNGMVLKSEGFAMNLSDPSGAYTLEAHCREHSIPYQSVGWPVPVEVFAAYGEAFQKRLVPNVETSAVRRIEKTEAGFELQLDTGECVEARHVVMATGIRPFSRLASILAELPDDKVTHSGHQGDMARFAGRRVAVLGGGASAMDAAAALHRSGATATVITHRPYVRFYAPTSFRSRRDRLLAPMTSLGPGWKKFLCVKLPDLFHALPRRMRTKIVSSYLGPAPAWSVHDIIQEHVDLRLNASIARAETQGDAIAITLQQSDGSTGTLSVDHVISATGYDVDIDRLTILSDGLRGLLRRGSNDLGLSASFESRVKGLYFVGTQAATNFGPMLRFVCGVDFAAARVARRVARSEGRQNLAGTRHVEQAPVAPMIEA